MAEVKDVKLYGNRLSTPCSMVHHALKLKGVAYEYVEEDLQSKSQALLSLNPVHKKVPVLVVDGRPIAESRIIMEYIDEAWKEPSLLPEDPYLKARVRFWVDFLYQKLGPATYAISRSEGEARHQAAKESMEHVNTVEQGIRKDMPGPGPFIHGETPGLLDVIIGTFSNGFRAFGEMAGVELVEKDRSPLLWSSMAAFMDLELAKDTMVSHEEFLEAKRALSVKATLPSGA